MKKISYATQGFTDRDLEAALDAVAKAGFSQTEILCMSPHLSMPLYGKSLLKFRNGLASRELSATLHAPMRRNVLAPPEEQWRKENMVVYKEFIRFSGSATIRDIITHTVPNPMFLEKPDDPEHPSGMIISARRSLDELVPVLRKTGTRLLLENLPYRAAYPFLTMTELRSLVDDYPAECVGLVIDTGHAAALTGDVTAEIQAAGDRLYGTHLQDIDTELKVDNHWPPGQGSLDWQSIIKALSEIEYPGAWTFEVMHSRNGESPEETARICRKAASDWGL